MATKRYSDETKQAVLSHLAQGKSKKGIADLLGVSRRTISTWEKEAQKQPLVQENVQEKLSDDSQLDFEDSPSPVVEQGPIEGAFSNLRNMLGLSDKKNENKPSPVLSAKLDAKRQLFVDSLTPTVTLACMAIATRLWSRIGEEYSELAPDETIAKRIVEPLIRIYARHASFMTDVNPDMADVGASMLALISYVQASMKMYQHIKAEKEEYEQTGTYPSDIRNYRQSTSENGASSQGNRYADVRRPDRASHTSNGSNDGNNGAINRDDLTDKQQREFAALSRLSQLDYQSRARRSGYAR